MKKVITVVLVLVLSGISFADFTAYNDSVGSSTGNVTTYGLIETGDPQTTTGLLKDYSSGSDTAVTATVTSYVNVGVNDQVYNWSGGSSTAASGTDFDNIFGGKVDMYGLETGEGPNWWVEIEFSGLDTSKTYVVVTSACRNRDNSADRTTYYSVTGADTYTNASSTGVTVVSEDKVKIVTGENYDDGYVAKWTGITATDGSFSIRAEATGDGLYAYGIAGFMLQEIPEPATMLILGLGGLFLRRRK